MPPFFPLATKIELGGLHPNVDKLLRISTTSLQAARDVFTGLQIDTERFDAKHSLEKTVTVFRVNKAPIVLPNKDNKTSD